ncbi:MAG: APA family basic amino acid/polyamine antiporter [Alphaproteobacteria bacterium]|jgi:APA family basic amino acid/polyamine antiporter
MGFWKCWGLVIGIVIGNGIFMLPAVLAPYGKLSLVGWIIAGIGTIFIALVLGMLAKRHSMQGGIYGYTRETQGDLTGFLIAWGYWISILAAVAVGAIAVAGYLSFFIPAISANPIIFATIAIAFIWLITAINMTGIKAACTFQLVTSLLKLLPLFIICIGALFLGDPTNAVLDSTISDDANQKSTLILISEMVMITMWAYIGIEAVTLPSDNVINPEKNIPRALIIGTLTVTVIYITLTYGVMTLIPLTDLAKSTAPLADAASIILGPLGAGFIAIAAIISMISSINANVLIVGIMPDALAKDKLMPEFFSKKNKAGIPIKTVVVSGFLASMLVVMNFSEGLLSAFKTLMMLSTLTVLLPYATSSLAEIIMQRRELNASTKINWVSFSIALIALLFSTFAIIGSGLMIALQGVILLAAGLPFYFWSKRKL